MIYLRTWARKNSIYFQRKKFLFQFSNKKHLNKHVIIRTKYEYNCTLRKTCLYSELFWSAFFRIRTEYGEIRSISEFSPNAGKCGPDNSEYGHFSRSGTPFVSMLFSDIHNITHIGLLGRRMDFIDIERSFSK